MSPSPQRIASVAIVLLLLMCGGLWWWQGRPSASGSVGKAPTIDPRASGPAVALPATPLPGNASAQPRVASAATRADVARCDEAMAAVLRQRTRELATRQDATSQLAYGVAASLTVTEGGAPKTDEELHRAMAEQRAVQQEAFARALALEPGNPEAAWLAASRCFEGADCLQAQQALLRAEPDNAAAWLQEISWARARGDQAASERAFQRAANAPRYDTHHGTALAVMQEAYRGVQTPAACRLPHVQAAMSKVLGGRAVDANAFAVVMAIATEAASVLPGAGLHEFCDEGKGRPTAPDRRNSCVKIYTAMATSSTLVEQSIATSRLIQLTGDSAEGRQWRERYRQLHWMIEQQAHVRDHLLEVATASNKVAHLQGVLQSAGRWPPPADWLPAEEHARSLIQTGRPPPENRR